MECLIRSANSIGIWNYTASNNQFAKCEKIKTIHIHSVEAAKRKILQFHSCNNGFDVTIGFVNLLFVVSS